jgi:hypothetical protein
MHMLCISLIAGAKENLRTAADLAEESMRLRERSVFDLQYAEELLKLLAEVKARPEDF